MTLSRAEIDRRFRERHPEAAKAYKAKRQPDRNCADCGVWSVHEALGLCRKCYKRVAQQRPGPKAVANARSAAWNEEHREETRQYFRDRMANDPAWAAKRRAHFRAMVARDPEANRQKVKRWQKENPEARRVQTNTRRARKLAIPSDLTAAQWIDILAEYGNRCVYCGGDGPMTMDHATPLARGGHHTASNVVPACAACNSSKGASTAKEFLARKGSNA